jgi:hypothetical protein
LNKFSIATFKNFQPLTGSSSEANFFPLSAALDMISGTKRGTPGADEEKSFMNGEPSDEDIQKLQAVQKDIARVELLLGQCHF